MSKHLFTWPAAVVVQALLLTGCASSGDRPVDQLARAEASIEHAEQNGAREYGAESLEKAQTKLLRAKLAADQGEYEEARRLARQAELDAEYASAQANRGKTDESLREVNASIETLRQEIERSSSQ